MVQGSGSWSARSCAGWTGAGCGDTQHTRLARGRGTGRQWPGRCTVTGHHVRGGEINGRRLISREDIARAARERFLGVNACSLAPTVFAAGFWVDAVGFGPPAGAGNFGHTGWGGSVACADPSRRLGFAFVTNRLLDAVYAAL